jgi:hypothetical protein
MKQFFTYLILFFGLILTEKFAFAGRETGNGGDPVAIDFLNRAYEAIYKVNNASEKFPEVSSLDLATLLDKTKIYVVDEDLIVNKDNVQQKSAAKNYFNPNRILINRASWNNISSPRLKESLALHELLSLKGVEETGVYSVVSRYEQLQSRPIRFSTLQLFWKFRTPSDIEQKQLSAFFPILKGYARAEKIAGVSQIRRLPAKVDSVRKDVAFQVVHLKLLNQTSNELDDKYQVLVREIDGNLLTKSIVLDDINFRVILGIAQEPEVIHLEANEKGESGYQIIPISGSEPHHHAFSGLKNKDVWDVVPLPNRYEALVLGQMDNGPLSLFFAHSNGSISLVKAFKQMIPGFEGSEQSKVKGYKARALVNAILRVYRNERGTYALVNDLEGIVVVNIETGESKAIYEVPEDGRFAVALRSKSAEVDDACTEITVGIYKNSQGQSFYSSLSHASNADFELPGSELDDPLYILNLGISATAQFFTVGSNGCR